MSYRELYLSRIRRKKKYGNKSQVYNGHRYDSIKEANYAEELDWRVKAGEIKEVERQVTFNLMVNGKKICGIRPDFRVTLPDGRQEIHEVKGFVAPEWPMKFKLLQALHPEYDYFVIR